ncbi:MAG TPA: GNAT family N-acetyltransferase [Acidobacteriaceae bacterium]|jgi:GNAT superfamily N-acetyltransferase|nr:GNAT family N-acetyltransferase [Acidobacteriaceae bacterium]
MENRSNNPEASAACILRLPKPEDYEKMAELAGQLGYPCTADQIRVRLDAMQGSSEHVVYVAALSDGQVAGWIGAFVFRSVELSQRTEISGLVVDQKFRSLGIGKHLVAAVEQWSRSHGCDAISVHCNVTRSDAHRFYRKNDYERVKTQELFHKHL